MRRLAQLLVWCGLLLSTSVLAWQAPPFPRLGGLFIGSPQNFQDASVQQQLARFQIVVLNMYPGWQNGRGTTMQQVVQNIKALNANTLVFPYTLMESLGAAAAGDPWAAERNALNNNKWWLYTSGTSGSPVLSGSSQVTNETLFTPTDANGYHFVDWFAHWLVQTYSVPAPSFDGLYSDNIFWRPQQDGDWNRDGTLDKASDPTVQSWLRQGERQYLNDLKALLPGKFLIGNITNFGQAAAVFPELQGQLNGGIMEGAIGFSWSPEAWGGWTTMMTGYRKIMGALAAPQVLMFHQLGTLTDYQSLRYGLASCLMDNGYFTFNSSQSYNDLPWFDEYSANLGQATSPPATGAWQHGVFRRDFENGIALVNPKGNGSQTVTLETSFKKISGTQASNINTGQTVTSVTLADRDGIILLRTTAAPVPPPAVKPPAPPQDVAVH